MKIDATCPGTTRWQGRLQIGNEPGTFEMQHERK
jgi:hypothetical protein